MATPLITYTITGHMDAEAAKRVVERAHGGGHVQIFVVFNEAPARMLIQGKQGRTLDAVRDALVAMVLVGGATVARTVTRTPPLGRKKGS